MNNSRTVIAFLLLISLSMPITATAGSTQIFASGFENELRQEFTGIQKWGTNAAIYRVQSPMHHGSWSLYAQGGDGGWNRALVYKTFDVQQVVYARVYVRFEKEIPLSQWVSFLWLSRGKESSTGLLGTVRAYHYSWGTKWSGTYYDSGQTRWMPNPPASSPEVTWGEWHCVELMVIMGSGTGEYALWADGVQIFYKTGLNNADRVGIDTVMVGMGETPPSSSGTEAPEQVLLDCLVVSNEYIGAEGPVGTLAVDTTPVKGEVFVDGMSWGTAPQSRILSAGTYTVSFGNVAGYVTPPPQTATVVTGEVTNVLGTYQPIITTGTLNVDTTPVKGEVFVDGKSWGIAPQARTLPEGTYTVSFGAVSGYVTPPPQTATVVAGQTTDVLGTYQPVGTLEVDTTPVKGEVFVDGTSWGIAPQARMLPEGTYTVSFGDFLGYVTPPPQSATVVAGKTTSVLGTYEPAPGTGTLSVDTTPVKGEVFVNGESWGIAPQARRLPEGTYTVSFGDVAGYRKPSPQTAIVVADTTTSVMGTYEKITTISTVVTTWKYPFEGTPRGIVEDPQSGVVWELHNFFFLDSMNNVVQVFPDLNKFIKWTIPTPDSGASFGVGIMNLRIVFFTEPAANKIGELISTQTSNFNNNFIEWTVPPSANGQSQPYGVVVASTASVYFTDIGADRIGRLSPQTNTFTMWSLPSGRKPSGITFYEGVIYFLELNRIGRLDGNTLTEWTVPPSFGSSSGYIFPSQGFLFVTSDSGNKIGRLDPSTNLFTEWTVPTSNGAPKGMWLSQFDPSLRLYFVESGSGKMGLLDTSSGGTETLLNATKITLAPISVSVTPVKTTVTPTQVIVPRTTTKIDGMVNGPFIEWSLPVPTVGLEALAPSTLRLFFTHNSGIVGRFQTVVNTISEWTLPETVNPDKLIVFSQKGIFFTELDNKIGKLDGIANTVTEWALPSSNAYPFAIASAVGMTGYVFTEEGANKIAKFDPATNTLTEWTVPTPESKPRGIIVLATVVYFAEFGTNKIGRLDTATNTFTEWTIPTASSGPTYVTWLSDKGCLAFTETYANKIGFLDPSSNTFREWVIPTANSFPTDLVPIQGGYLYFAESGSNKIGRMAIYNWGTVFDEWIIPTVNPDGPNVIPSMYRSVVNLFFTEATSNKIAFFDPSLSPKTSNRVELTTSTVAPTIDQVPPVVTTLTPEVKTASYTWKTVIGVATDGFVEWDIPTPMGNYTTEMGEFFTESGAHKIGRLYIRY